MCTLHSKYIIKHKRNGHLFQDRFKSKIIGSESYLINLSAYIHNNPVDIKRYRQHPERYRFSSLGVYLGMNKDPFGILDVSFIMQLFGKDVQSARERYYSMVFASTNTELIKDAEFTDEKTCYKSGRVILVRNFKKEDILDYVSGRTKVHVDKIRVKSSREAVEGKALCVLLMRGLCDYKCKDICEALGSITQSRVSKLCSIGLKLMDDERYKTVIRDFIEKYSA
jgi:hypothetical protein